MNHKKRLALVISGLFFIVAASQFLPFQTKIAAPNQVDDSCASGNGVCGRVCPGFNGSTNLPLDAAEKRYHILLGELPQYQADTDEAQVGACFTPEEQVTAKLVL